MARRELNTQKQARYPMQKRIDMQKKHADKMMKVKKRAH